MRGYRIGETQIPFAKLDPETTKKNMIITGCLKRRADCVDRIPISRTLPIYFDEFALFRPDPDYPPNVVIGVLARIGMQPPKIDPVIKRALKMFVSAYCEQFLTPLEPDSVDFKDWIENTPYSRKRKDQLIKVWFDSDTECVFDDKRKTEIKSFIKDEPYDEPKAPRSINSRADWFKCYSGPLFQAIGHEIFHGSPDFIKTVAVREQPADIMADLHDAFSPITINDATSYEAHFIKETMNIIEFTMYHFMCRRSADYSSRMKTIQKVLTGEQKLKFKLIQVTTDCLRMSGEMNTSLGNGFTTQMLVKFIAFIRSAIIRLRAEGDDNLTRWSDERCIPTKEDWWELGWNMKVERPACVAEASFCGNVFDPDEQLVIVNPREVLLNFGWVKKQYVNASDSILMGLMRCKALSMYHQYNGCPLLGHFGLHVIRMTDHIKIRRSIIDSMNLYEKEEYLSSVKDELPDFIPPSESSRDIVRRLYNISVEEQIAFEESVPAITLWSKVQVNFSCPEKFAFNFEHYTHPIGEEWVCQLPPNEEAVLSVIRSFGRRTEAFLAQYE
jgi:hypothetical protein